MWGWGFDKRCAVLDSGLELRFVLSAPRLARKIWDEGFKWIRKGVSFGWKVVRSRSSWTPASCLRFTRDASIAFHLTIALSNLNLNLRLCQLFSPDWDATSACYIVRECRLIEKLERKVQNWGAATLGSWSWQVVISLWLQTDHTLPSHISCQWPGSRRLKSRYQGILTIP